MSRQVALSVVVPAYREGAHIHDSLQLLLTELDACQQDYEVVLVADGSPDDTVAEASRVGSSRIRIVSYSDNAGKGFALRRGWEAARGELVVFIDADMELHPRAIRRFLTMLRENRCDIVVGSKRHPDSLVSYPLFRRAQSFAYQALVRVLFDLSVTDTQTGLKAFRRDVLAEVMPLVLVKRFAFDVELLALAWHFGFRRICEAPVELNYKFESTTNLRAVYQVLWDTMAVFYRLRVLRYYDRRRHVLAGTDGPARRENQVSE